MTKSPGSLRDALERTLAADELYSRPAHAGTVALAREIADQLDASVNKSGELPSRLLATYTGILAQLRRTLRDEENLRRKTARKESAPASRIASIKRQAQVIKNEESE